MTPGSDRPLAILEPVHRRKKDAGCTFYHNITRTLHNPETTRKAIFLQCCPCASDLVYAMGLKFLELFCTFSVCERYISFRALKIMGAEMYQSPT